MLHQKVYDVAGRISHRIALSTRQREIRIALALTTRYGAGDENDRMSRIGVNFFELSVFAKS